MAKKKQKTLPETNVLEQPEDFKEFLENLDNFLKQTKNNETVSKNFPLLCSIVEALKDSPFENFKSIFAEMAKSINAQRLEKVAVENKIKLLEKEEERLAKVVEVKREKVKEAEKSIADSIKDAESVYQERLSGLTKLDASLKKKEKSINSKLNQIERMKTETVLIKQKIEKESAEVKKELEANKNYLAVINREKSVLKKQEESNNISAQKLKTEQRKFQQNGERVRKAIEELQQQRDELTSREREIRKKADESRKVIQEANSAKKSTQKHAVDLEVKKKEISKKEAEIKGLIGTLKTVGERIEKRYGISNLINFAEEKQAIIDDSNRVALMQAAFNAVIMQARKKGWSPKEIEIPVLEATGGDEYIQSLL